MPVFLRDIAPQLSSHRTEALFLSNNDFRKAILLMHSSNLLNTESSYLKSFLFNLLDDCAKNNMAYKMAYVIDVIYKSCVHLDIETLYLLDFAKHKIENIYILVHCLYKLDERNTKMKPGIYAFESIIYKALAGFTNTEALDMVKTEITHGAFGVVYFLHDIFNGTIDTSQACIIPYADSNSLKQFAVALSSPRCPNGLLIEIQKHYVTDEAISFLVDVLRTKAPLTTTIVGLSEEVEKVCNINSQKDIILQLNKLLYIFECESNCSHFLTGLSYALDLIKTYYVLLDISSENIEHDRRTANCLLQYFMARLLSSKACISIQLALESISSQAPPQMLKSIPSVDSSAPRIVESSVRTLLNLWFYRTRQEGLDSADRKQDAMIDIRNRKAIMS